MINKISKSKSVWGLYVSESCISAVKVSTSTKALIVEEIDTINYSEVGSSTDAKLPEPEIKIEFKNVPAKNKASVRPEQGVKIEDIAKQLSAAIKLFYDKNRITSSDKILIAIPSQFVLSRFVNLPSVNKRQLKEIVKFEVEKHIPIDINDIIWDFHSLGDKIAENKNVEIGIFAIKKERYLYIFVRARTG